MPIEELKAFRRISLKINEEGTASFSIALSELKKWDNAKSDWKLYSWQLYNYNWQRQCDARLIIQYR